MKKQSKSQPIIKSIEELISDFDRPQLVRALEMLESDMSWKVLRAALMKEYVSMASYVLDDSARTGRQIEAAYKAGAAQTMYDIANSLIEKYKDVISQRLVAVEADRPEE